MGTHFRFSAGTACGVDGQRKLHERVSAIAEGVVFTRLNPRQLKKKANRPRVHSFDQDYTGSSSLAQLEF